MAAPCEQHVVNIDLGAFINIDACIQDIIDANLAALVGAGIHIPGIPNFTLSLDLLLPGNINFPNCMTEPVGGTTHPLPIFTTKNVLPPILVTTVLPTTVVPLNPLSAVSPTIPPTLPFTSIEPTPDPTVPPTIIPNPPVTPLPPNSPCNTNPCNFLNF